jgi:hypothetical protein
MSIGHGGLTPRGMAPVVFNAVKNLILVVNNKRYDPRDFIDIADRVAKRAPDIRSFVVGVTMSAADMPKDIWQNPTLTVMVTVSVWSKTFFKPLRGRVLGSRKIEKLEQAEILQKAGIPTPHSEIYSPGMDLDPAIWGEFVIMKPAPLKMTSKGDSIQMFRRARLASMTLADFAPDHAVHTAPMLIQPFIETGLHPMKYRSLMFCGEPLYVQETVLKNERPDPAAPDEVIEHAVVATNAGERWYRHGDYPDVAAFAKRVAGAFPDIPLMGVDIVRDIRSGELMVLEVNAGGNVWHFSSPMWAERRRKYPEVARQMREQFNAFDTAARALASATRRLAS